MSGKVKDRIQSISHPGQVTLATRNSALHTAGSRHRSHTRSGLALTARSQKKARISFEPGQISVRRCRNSVSGKPIALGETLTGVVNPHGIKTRQRLGAGLHREPVTPGADLQQGRHRQ